MEDQLATRNSSRDFKPSASEDEIHYVDERHAAPVLPVAHDVLIRIDEVLRMIPVSKASWYAGVKKGFYPPSVPLGPRSVAWRLSDITLVIAGAWQARASA